MGNINIKTPSKRNLVILDLIALFLCCILVSKLFSIILPDLQLINDCKTGIIEAGNCKYAGLATIVVTYAAIVPVIILVILFVFIIKKKNSINQVCQMSAAVNSITIISIVACILTLVSLLVLGVLGLVSLFG